MKLLLAILVAFSALASWGCGTDETQTESSGTKAAQAGESEEEAGAEAGANEERRVAVVADAPRSRFGTITLGSGKAQPKIHPPDKPKPRKILIRDLAIGTGPIARFGDRASIYYYSVRYETGERVYLRWPPEETLTERLIEPEPWHRAIVGMRAGGRREMIIPSRLLFSTGTMDYFIELVSVNGRGGGRQSKS